MGKMPLTDYTSSYTKYVNSKYYFKLQNIQSYSMNSFQMEDENFRFNTFGETH